MHCHIIKSFYNDTALGMFLYDLIFILGNGLKHFIIRDTRKMVFFVFLIHAVYDLTFF